MVLRCLPAVALILATLLAFSDATTWTLPDPLGDEFATYPTNPSFPQNTKGLFDIKALNINSNANETTFSVAFANATAFAAGGATNVIISLYVDIDGALGSFRLETTGTKEMLGENVQMALDPRMNYELGVVYSGEKILKQRSAGGLKAFSTVSYNAATGFSVTYPGSIPITDATRVTVMAGALDTAGGSYAKVGAQATNAQFGGGSDTTYSPNAIDILDGGWTASQNVVMSAYCIPKKTQAVATAVPLTQTALPATPPPTTTSPPDGCPKSSLSLVKSRQFDASNVAATETGITGDLVRAGAADPADTFYYGDDIPAPSFQVQYISKNIVRVKLASKTSARYEVPRVMSGLQGQKTTKSSGLNYNVETTSSPFSIKVTRKDTGAVLFDTSQANNDTYGHPNVILKDQYLQISTRLDPKSNLYGLGERYRNLLLDRNSTTYTMFNFDLMQPQTNLYGTHPFIMNHIGGAPSATHGIFLLNSNSMDVILDSDMATYKTIGGVLDFYIMTGPSPESVIQQYQGLIGNPMMPPYWSLGFHQCRWGYKDVAALEAVRKGYADAKIPLEAIWSDIDYMDKKKLFTLDPVNYPADKLRPFVDKLHANDQRYVVIIDPGVKIEKTGYPAYTRGLADNLFIKLADNTSPAVGKVWPGLTTFIDFYHKNSTKYWTDFFQDFHDTIPYDGLWIDMNEVASFCDGHCLLDVDNPADMGTQFGCPCGKTIAAGITEYDFPMSYWPGAGTMSARIPGGKFNPGANTISMSSLHETGIREYDLHSLYGHLEAQASYAALKQIRQKRPFVLTRSSYAGTGKYAGKWTGDNTSRWRDLRMSIPGMLMMNLFGIPYVGSDICGFFGNTNVELCTRWIQLGAFYPFSRDHNNINQTSQELYALGDQVQQVSIASLNLRYTLLPYYYSNFARVHLNGGMVMNPLFAQFPDDSETYAIDDQFLIGKDILVSPVLSPGDVTVNAYLPAGRWYPYPDGQRVPKAIDVPTGTRTVLDAPYIGTVPMHVRGGVIIPLQGSALTTTAAQKQPRMLLVALNDIGTAVGELYVDDGDSIDTFENKQYAKWTLEAVTRATDKTIVLTIARSDKNPTYTPPIATNWTSITLLGVDHVAGVKFGDSLPIPPGYSLTQDKDAGLVRIDLIGGGIPLTTSFTLELVGVSESSPTPLPSMSPKQSPGPGQPDGKVPWVPIIIACCLAVVLMGAVGGFWHWKKQNDSKKAELAFNRIDQQAAIDFENLDDHGHDQPFANR